MIIFNNPKSIYEKYKKELNNNILKVLQNGQYVKSKELDLFEKNFAKFNRVKYAVGVGNATDAIYISLKSLNIKKNDEVITVSHTATGTVMAILNTGATPIFCDISENDYNIDLDLIESKITNKTKAIVVVHLYGQSCNLTKLLSITKKYKIPLIEDCSQAAGSKFKKKYLGSFGDFGCFSFFPTKNLSCFGDGGMIISNKKIYKNKIECFREYGWDRNRNAKYVGINSRLDEIQAAILNIKLKYLKADNIERREIAKYYNKNIQNKKIIKPLQNPNSYHVYHLYVIRLKNRKYLIKKLINENIIPGIHYKKAVHQQKILAKFKYNLPVTEKVANTVLSLPIYPGLEEKNMKKIVNIINDI